MLYTYQIVSSNLEVPLVYAAPQSATVLKVGEQLLRDPDSVVVAVADEDVVQGVADILAGLALRPRVQKPPLFALLSNHVDVVADQKPAEMGEEIKLRLHNVKFT